MKRIENLFSRLKEKKEKALIPYITVGDPTLQATKELVSKLEENGSDLIELGVPFSDPTADGPTIQQASLRALANNVSLKDVLVLVKEIRKTSEIPIILMGYYNPFFIYGVEKFASDAKFAGVDGVLVVDLPMEEAPEMKIYLDKTGLDMIFLFSPTTAEERIEIAATQASGYIYYVSVTGVTGARKQLSTSIEKSLKKIKKYTNLPVGVGFGISTPRQAQEVSKLAEGIIVGSALIKIIAANRDHSRMLEEAGNFIFSLKSSIKG